MRRLSLSAKLFVAALPLLLALGALMVVSTRESFGDVSDARRGAQLGSIWEPLITAITSIESEQTVAESDGTTEANNDARRITNEVMVDLNARLLDIGDSHPLVLQVGQAMTALGLAREGVDNPDMAAARRMSAAASFDQAENELITLGRLLPAEAGDVDLGRQLTAVAALAETEQALTSFVEQIARNETQPAAEMDLEPAAFHATAMTEAANLFQAVAPEDWRERYRESGFARALNDGRRALEQLQTYDPATGASRPDIDVARLTEPSIEIGPFRDTLANEAVERADAHADDLQTSTWWRTGITLGAVVIAFLMAWIITRSITRRVRKVKDKANEVADTQLPALVSALNDPRSQGKLPEVAPIEDRGADEVAELAAAFNAVQATLVDVAHEQVEVLRRGVSDIFVTMARRNRSLVDRQLALLDELEAEVDDPDVLSNYYQLDHLATRMRRNSESLLVLANAETRRRRTRATEIDDVVRAAMGEVEDYRRVDVMHLDSLQVRGGAVADLSHLLAELIDNATSFSPPDSRVRVAGGFHDDGYLITIADEGVGITHDRMLDLNALLASPPIVGLSVEPTLGMSVVSLLANKHGVVVTLAAASPGVAVEVMLPSDLYGPIDAAPPAPTSDDAVVVAAAAAAAAIPADRLVEWVDESEVDGFVPAEPIVAAQPLPAGEVLLRAGDVNATDAVVDPASPAAPRLWLSGDADPAPAAPASELVPAPVPVPDPPVTDAGLPMRRATAPSAPAFDFVDDTDDVDVDLAALSVEPSWSRNGDSHSNPVLGPESSRNPDISQPRIVQEEDTAAAAAAQAVAQAAETTPATTAAAAAETTAAGDTTATSATATAAAADALFLPPTPGARVAGEFDRPPAPPAFGTAPVARPVVDPNARPVPPRRPDEPPAPPSWDRGGSLPTRSRGNAPDGGVDRIGGDSPMVVPAVPSSLQAALTAFDAGRNGRPPSLPTRNPGAAGNGDHGGVDRDGQPASIAPSKLDADAIRERLRAFQTEYKFGRHDGADEPMPADHDSAHGEDHGGDR